MFLQRLLDVLNKHHLAVYILTLAILAMVLFNVFDVKEESNQTGAKTPAPTPTPGANNPPAAPGAGANPPPQAATPPNPFAKVIDLGCWKDDWARAMEIKDDRADDYSITTGNTARCRQWAKDKGYNLWAIQDGIQCFAHKDPNDQGYKKYGAKTDGCTKPGFEADAGGPWGNHVYKLVTADTPQPPL